MEGVVMYELQTFQLLALIGAAVGAVTLALVLIDGWAARRRGRKYIVRDPNEASVLCSAHLAQTIWRRKGGGGDVHQ